jgi:hypothetical protein
MAEAFCDRLSLAEKRARLACFQWIRNGLINPDAACEAIVLKTP